MKGEHLMNTIAKLKSKHRSRGFLLSVLCAGIIATFMNGCAEGPYVTEYETGYYPTAYYTPDYYGYPYSYYGPTTSAHMYALASVTMMLTARATTEAEFTAIGIN